MSAPSSDTVADPARIPPLQLIPENQVGRDFAVGDIHGHFSILERSLAAIGFDPTRDRLFSVGDMVDRGPESEQVLDWLGKPWFHAIQGNHEVMTCVGMTNPRTATAHRRYGGQWFYELDRERQAGIVAALSALPVLMEIATAEGPVVLSHADLPAVDWWPFRYALETGSHHPRDLEFCQWATERLTRQFTGSVRHTRAVVHGHQTLPRIQALGNVFFIDTFHSELPAGQQGRFTFLELGSLMPHHGPGEPWSAPKPSGMARL